MTDFNLEPGAPNLDAMQLDDLYSFARATRGVSPRRAARALFPDERKGATRAVRDLHNYAWNAITAWHCRERGDVDAALRYDLICNQIYDALPPFARW